jgi:Arc/MetJ-type ribon-helix-helix transcriptional regulator
MTIHLKPGQEKALQAAIEAGAFRSVDEFVDTAIATLPTMPKAGEVSDAPRKSRLWELRRGLQLGDTSIRELIDEGRE